MPLSQRSLEMSLIRPFHNCSPAKLYNDHTDLSAVLLSSLELQHSVKSV